MSKSIPEKTFSSEIERICYKIPRYELTIRLIKDHFETLVYCLENEKKFPLECFLEIRTAGNKVVNFMLEYARLPEGKEQEQKKVEMMRQFFKKMVLEMEDAENFTREHKGKITDHVKGIVKHYQWLAQEPLRVDIIDERMQEILPVITPIRENKFMNWLKASFGLKFSK